MLSLRMYNVNKLHGISNRSGETNKHTLYKHHIAGPDSDRTVRLRRRSCALTLLFSYYVSVISHDVVRVSLLFPRMFS